MNVRLGLLIALVAACDLGSRDVPDAGPGGPGVASTACSSVCHGSEGEAAPPRDTSGRTDLASVGVGAHRQHLGSSDWHKRLECSTCHTVPDQIGAVGHMDTPLPAELSFTGLGVGAVWDRTTETCTNSYCHGATLTNSLGMGMTGPAGGTATEPVWTLVDGSQSQCNSCHGDPPPAPHPPGNDCGQCHPTMNPGAGMVIAYPELHIDGHLDVVNTAACDSCHGQNGQSAPPMDTSGGTATTLVGVGAHAKHMAADPTKYAQINCVECHTVPAGVNDLGHIDTPLPAEIVWGPTAGNGAWNGTTCTNTYCHGGPNTPLKGGSATSPQWTKVDNTQNTCGSCHGNPPNDTLHASATPTNCANCHPTMTPGVANQIALPALHIDGKVDTTVGAAACNSCHGSANSDAPPQDTQGNTSTNLRSVGAHQVHLAASTWRKNITCDACHKVPGGVTAIGHTDTPLPAELTFSVLAGTPTWTGTQCTNTYCHGSTLGGGTSKNPVWTTVTGAQSQCGSCHGEPPPPPHPVDNDCGKCHNTMTAGVPGVITDPTRHIDGNLDVDGDLACNSCHGAGTSDAPPKDTAGNTATTARGVGAHQQHLATTNRFRPVLCSDCHLVPGSVNSVGHRDTPLPAELRFSTLAGTNTAWNGSRCSNNYCHGATLGAGGTATAPIWNTVNGSQAQCTSCHGMPPNTPNHTPTDTNCSLCHPNATAGNNPTSFIDPSKHVDGNVDATGGQACSSCHGTAGVNDAPPKDTTNGTGTNLRGVGAHQVHLTINPALYKPMTCDMCHNVPAASSSAGHRDTPLPAELVPKGVAAGTTFNGTTCTSYCHGSTIGGTAPTWTNTTNMTCTSCHGNPPPPPHPTGTNCQQCHDTAGPTASSIAKPLQHIDGITQTQNVHPTGYNAREMHGYDADKNGFSTCATASCHGTTMLGGTSGGPSCSSCHTANWQTNCTFCHGTTGQGAPPAGVMGATAPSDKHVGAHTEHTTATTNHAAFACTACHTLPSTATTPGHVDGTGGVVQAEVVYSSLNPAATFNTTTAVCSNLYCHGNGRTAAGTATWTSTTALTCTSCHPTTSLTTGEHKKHIKDEGMKCNECHSTVSNATPAIINPALHVNGLKEVKMSPSGTWTPANKSCSSLPNGCHGTKSW